jgi:hypothetical protein
MVDKSVSGLFLTLIIDSIIFAVVMILYFIFSKTSAAPQMESYPSYMKTSHINVRDYSLSSLYRRIFSTDSSEIKENLGISQVFYLGYLNTICKIVLIIGFFGMSILIPVYAVGSNEVKTEMDLIGIGHVNGDGELLAPSIVLIVFFSAVLDLCLINYSKPFGKNQDEKTREYKARDISYFTLWVWGLPREVSSESMQTDFEKIVSEYDREGTIQMAYVIPNYSKSYQHLLQIQEYQTNLDYLQRYEKV